MCLRLLVVCLGVPVLICCIFLVSAVFTSVYSLHTRRGPPYTRRGPPCSLVFAVCVLSLCYSVFTAMSCRWVEITV